MANPTFAPVVTPEHVYTGGWEHFVGGGLASFDCNGDQLPELFAAGGAETTTLLINASKRTGPIIFEASTPNELRLTSVTGAYPLNLDSDDFVDLVVLRAGQNILMKGSADCSFAPFQTLSFASDDKWTTAFSATWEADQTLPTLAFGNYVDREDPDGPFRACDKNLLYRPVGSTYGPPKELAPGYCPLSMLFSDWGRKGRADLRISNDRHYYVDDGQEQMWSMDEVPHLYSQADGWQIHKLWGMGIASRDLTGDGLPEVFLTSMGDQRMQQLVHPNQPTYQDVTYEMGTTAHRPYQGGDGRPSTGWHVVFGDVQNDGLDDVFIAKGNVEQMPDSAMDDPNNLLVQNPQGTFSEAGDIAGLASFHRGRGAAMVDFNGDGLLDIAVVNRRAPLQIWQNTTPDTGNWLKLSLTQNAPNRNAIGGWIELDAGQGIRTREITVGGGHAGGSAGPEHFGLGDAASANVRVMWPDGLTSDWVEIDANLQVALKRDGASLKISRY